MKNGRWFRLSVGVGLGLALMAQSQAQEAQQTPAPTAVIKIDVNLVQVDAVVTDANGRPVTDLTVDDFELLQDGEPQKINSFEFVNLAERRSTTAPPPISVQRQTRDGDVPPPQPMTSLRPEQIQRTIAIVVDDLALSFDSAVRVRDSLKKWVDTEMLPGDLVAIVRTRSGMGSLQRFSMDPQTLRAAIDQIRYSPGRVGVSSVAALQGPLPADGVIDTRQFDDEVAYAYLTGSLTAIRDVIRGLRDLPGRKSLILFTEDMTFTYLEGTVVPTKGLMARTGETFMRRIADEANRSSVVIHAVDPRGVFYAGLTAEDRGDPLEDASPVEDPSATGATTEAEVAAQEQEQLAAEQAAFEERALAEINGPLPPAVAGMGGRVNERYDRYIASRDGMVDLTRRTGGLFAPNSNDLGAALRLVVDDGDGYYLLGYQPDLSTFELNQQSAFHTLKVRVKRPGLTVRSRSGFFGRPDTQPLPEPEARRNQLTRALTSPFGSDDVRVRLTGLVYPSAKGASITTMLHFDTRDVTFTDTAEGKRSAEFDIVAVAFDAEGEPIDTMARTAKIEIPREIYPELLKSGFIYALEVPVKKPGAYQLRAVLRDTTTQRMGSAMQFVNVPDFKNGRLTLSGIVLTEQSTPPGIGELEQSPRAAQPGSPALRVFKPGTTLVYGYQVLNARTDGDKKTQLDSRIRLFRNGQQVYEGAAQNILQENAPLDSKRQGLGVAGRIQLVKLQPGSYVLQIIVQDNNRYDKYRVAAQAIDFEVQQTTLEQFPN